MSITTCRSPAFISANGSISFNMGADSTIHENIHYIPNGNTPKSAQPINQERDRPEWVNIPQTNAQWLQQMEFLSDLSYPAMIPPIDIMENRPDIYRKWSISIETYRNLFQAM
ncbi:hypothetical protein Glove_46g22 [Diversispora epigaea]|uniref:Uncharacterized protein n=1 Tax=Diversispora epigaea TaxID=1348612 RepID=A0A397JIU2_9GLOM|nr:hypothetical protein Glove_46g22 [Diversispora epigaea]